MDNNEFAQGQVQHYPIMAIGDTLVSQLLVGLPKEHAQVMLEDLNQDGFHLLVNTVGRITAEMILTAAQQETGGDLRHLQHVRVQAITLASVFTALGANVKAFAEGSHFLSQAEPETDAEQESDGAL